MNKEMKLIYTTIDNKQIAEELASKAIKDKITACVNIIPNITSIYKWENKIEKSSEYILLFKTTCHNEKELMKWIEQHHPYSVPAIISLNANTSIDFLTFIEENTNKDKA